MLQEQVVEGQGLRQLAVAVEVLLAQQVQVLVQVHSPPLVGVEWVQGLQVQVVPWSDLQRSSVDVELGVR